LLIHNHERFVERAREEISRAQRYCLYLSLLIIEVSPNNGGQESESLDAAIARLGRSVGQVLRASDLVAPLGRGLLGILLVEAPGHGLDVVASRVERFTIDFLGGSEACEGPPKVGVAKACYPDEIAAFRQMLAYLGADQQIGQGDIAGN
jgi:hypothetical protein